jgi:hypothetical protein
VRKYNSHVAPSEKKRKKKLLCSQMLLTFYNAHMYVYILFSFFFLNIILKTINHKKMNDIIKTGFRRGMVSFAGNGIHSRTEQVFIAFSDSDELGQQPWETPLGYVESSGMENLDKMTMYGDFSEFGGNGPDPDRLKSPDTKEYLEVGGVCVCMSRCSVSV